MITIPRVADARSPFREETVPIATVNWASFPSSSTVRLFTAWDGNLIHLRFEVNDTAVLALVTEDNGPVWRDRCVEWFVSFDGRCYYNIEANPIGTLLVQYGPSRSHRRFIEPERLVSIHRTPSLGRAPLPLVCTPTVWSLTLLIPVAFFAPEGNHLSPGTVAHGNFHFCGDDLPERQYLTHYPITTERPNFHRPDCLGPLYFT